jgi:hypothetical protein
MILLAAVVFNIAKLPYAMWFKVVILIAIPAAVFLGLRLPSRRESTAVCSAN